MKDLKDQHRLVRPITETTQASIDRVRVAIETDRWSTFYEIEAEALLSRLQYSSDHLLPFEAKKINSTLGTPSFNL